MLNMLCNDHVVHALSIESYYLPPPTRCHAAMIITLNLLLTCSLRYPDSAWIITLYGK